MRNSLSRQRGKLPWKPSGRPLATPAMPPAKLGSEKADIGSPIDRAYLVYRVEIARDESRPSGIANITVYIDRVPKTNEPEFARLSRAFKGVGIVGSHTSRSRGEETVHKEGDPFGSRWGRFCPLLLMPRASVSIASPDDAPGMSRMPKVKAAAFPGELARADHRP
jgi:hypothetical protein